METLQQLGAVLLVLGLLGAAVYSLKRKPFSRFAKEFRLGSGAKRLQVIERVSLTPQHTLCLVRVGDRELIVTTAPGNCHVIPTNSQTTS